MMPFNPLEKLIIESMADFNLNTTDVANHLMYHRNSILYHLNKIKQFSGLDPRKFYDLVKLLELIKEETSNENQT